MNNEYKEQIVNLITNEVTWRDYSPEEIAIHNAKKEQLAKEKAELNAKESARLAILAKLGLTNDEAQLLLGGN